MPGLGPASSSRAPTRSSAPDRRREREDNPDSARWIAARRAGAESGGAENYLAGVADLLVMSSRGRSGLGRLVLGSVAESVLRATRTPILLIHAVFAPIDAQSSPVARELPLAGVI